MTRSINPIEENINKFGYKKLGDDTQFVRKLDEILSLSYSDLLNINEFLEYANSDNILENGFISEVRGIKDKIEAFKQQIASLPAVISQMSDEAQQKLFKAIVVSPFYQELLSKISTLRENSDKVAMSISPEKIFDVIADIVKSSAYQKKLSNATAQNETFTELVSQNVKEYANKKIDEFPFSAELEKKVQDKTKEYTLLAMKEQDRDIEILKLRTRLSVVALNLSLKLNIFKSFMPFKERHYQPNKIKVIKWTI